MKVRKGPSTLVGPIARAIAAEHPCSPWPRERPQLLFTERKRKFAEARKGHYKTGGLAALRAQAAAMDEEDEEDL